MITASATESTNPTTIKSRLYKTVLRMYVIVAPIFVGRVKILKVVQSNPGTVNEAVDEAVLNESIGRRFHKLIGLERQDDAGHGEIGKQKQPYRARQNHRQIR